MQPSARRLIFSPLAPRRVSSMLSVSYVAVRADIDLSVCLSLRSINGYARRRRGSRCAISTGSSGIGTIRALRTRSTWACRSRRLSEGFGYADLRDVATDEPRWIEGDARGKRRRTAARQPGNAAEYDDVSKRVARHCSTDVMPCVSDPAGGEHARDRVSSAYRSTQSAWLPGRDAVDRIFTESGRRLVPRPASSSVR